MSTRRLSWIGFGLAFSTLVACSGGDVGLVGDPLVEGNEDAGSEPVKTVPVDGSTSVTPPSTPPVADQDGGQESKDASTSTDSAVADSGKENKDGGGLGDGGLGDGGDGYGKTCTNNQECTTSFPKCVTFLAKGRHCTKTCKKDIDCPAGSGGCNNLGNCRIP